MPDPDITPSQTKVALASRRMAQIVSFYALRSQEGADKVASDLDSLIKELGGKPVGLSPDRLEIRLAVVFSLVLGSPS